jgi:7-keto-8-aminopelargonate synthetase-like enzyme
LRGLDVRLNQLIQAKEERSQIRTCQETLLKKLNINWTHESPIVPILIGEGDQALQLSTNLWNSGVFCPAILPPTVPNGQAKLRVSLNATHHLEDIDILAQAIQVSLASH